MTIFIPAWLFYAFIFVVILLALFGAWILFQFIRE